MWTERFAPAKVNLFLHVGGVAPDGYHPVCSLMVFADAGDVVRLGPSPNSEMSFSVVGPFSDGLAGEGNNLVTRARESLIAQATRPPAPFALELDKRLPIAAGLGGGSADAAAALALVEAHLIAEGVLAPDPARLPAIARTLGADVTACLRSTTVVGRGHGDDLEIGPTLPVLHGVLVNPLAPSPTGAVYRAYDALEPAAEADEPPVALSLDTVADVVTWLSLTRNDLEAPAVALQPLIGDVLTALAEAPETLFSRMSGSGATCFALAADPAQARALADRLKGDHPQWWIEACRFGA